MRLKWENYGRNSRQSGRTMFSSQPNYQMSGRDYGSNQRGYQNNQFGNSNFGRQSGHRQQNRYRSASCSRIIPRSQSTKPSNRQLLDRELGPHFVEKITSQSEHSREVIKVMISLLLENKNKQKIKTEAKVTKRNLLPPFSGTQSVGEEGIHCGFFCKYCEVYCTSIEMLNNHLVTKRHYLKVIKFDPEINLK